MPRPRIDPNPASIFKFTPPGLTLELALGHKRGGWYLLFARPYRTADSREVTRLDTRNPCLKIKNSSDSGAPRFLFDLQTASGWERDGENLLDFLLLLGWGHPPVLRCPVEGYAGNDSVMEVEVLIPEHRLAHWCEACGNWESVRDEGRWIKVEQTRLPLYLCPSVRSHLLAWPPTFTRLPVLREGLDSSSAC
ncbi:uncharacterized protein ARMOST_01297 [Armillaria ostoyae]|uniref:Uncharacterized protein n=1 Tax=Armillaria ostoyae TaxID=47428 RepID=A0A284QNJ6_ARMOS|nr:uncharacterized protein ARMOST_01297 [Armillaria ostoyae]